MEFTLSQFNQYVEPGGLLPKRHIFYNRSVTAYDGIKVHANGEKPGDLLTKRRPSESTKIQEYRECIYVPITKGVFTKVIGSLNKIRKSQDWSIKYNAKNSLIREEESLQNYIELLFPKYTSLTNWYFQLGLRNQLIDTNAKVFVRPLNYILPDNEYIKPYPFIFNSDQVIDYETGKYYVLRSKEQITYTENNQTYHDGQRWYVVTDTNIQIFDQYSHDGKYKEAFSYKHELGFVPVYDFKGIVIEEDFSQTLYESKIQAMIPFLDEAVREYSDMQAEVVQHIHSTLWADQPNDCKKCKGTGEIIKKEKNVNVRTPCSECNGKGHYPFNPYENYIRTKAAAGETPRQGAPAGFIEKNTAIVTIQDLRIEAHKHNAYAAINLEFLSQTPLNISGLAKSVDREEGNNFVHGVAEDGVELLDNLVFCIGEYRNRKAVKNIADRKKLLPVINVPEKYDLLSDGLLLDDLIKMKGNVDPAVYSAAELDYTKKRFNTDPKIADLVSLKLSLDPFAGDSEETLTQKQFRENVLKINFVIHDNISQFIERAIEEHPSDGKVGFVKMAKKDQREILKRYAEETLKELEETEEYPEVITEPIPVAEPVIVE